MPETQKTTSTSSTSQADTANPPSGEKSTKAGSDVGQDQVQAQVDKETEQGYRGFTNDEGDYTVGGSVAGKNNPDAGKVMPEGK